jgi:hypothetical protein
LIARRPSVPSEPVPDSDPDRVLALVLGKLAEEQVDRMVQPVRARMRRDREPAIPNAHRMAGRQDIDLVRLQRRTVLGGGHLHVGIAGENLGEVTVPVRCHMGQNDAAQPRPSRHPPEEQLQRLQASGRSADANHGVG